MPDKVLRAFETEWDADFEKATACRAVAFLSDGDREEVRAVLKASLAPCGRAVAAEMVYGLAVSLPSQSREADDRKARAMMYASMLQDFPNDILTAACERLLREEEWFPPIARILRRVEPETNRRKLMLAALDKPPVLNCTMLTKPDGEMRRLSFDPTAICEKYGVAKSEPKPTLPALAKPGLSQAQIDAAKAKDQAAYWLEMMSAG